MLARTHRRRPFIQVVSLLDVFTILLFYFMLFTTFRTTPAGVNINLPKAVTAETKAARDLEVTVDAAGQIYAQGQRTNVTGLTSLAKQYLTSDPNLTVTIKADEATKYENVVTAIDAVRTAGAYRLRLAVNLHAGSVQ